MNATNLKKFVQVIQQIFPKTNTSVEVVTDLWGKLQMEDREKLPINTMHDIHPAAEGKMLSATCVYLYKEGKSLFWEEKLKTPSLWLQKG